MNTVFDKISTGTKMSILAFLVSVSVCNGASAGPVTISAGFGEYSGAVGNGIGIYLDRVYQSFMNGSNIAPSEALPGLETLFSPPDQGIGRGIVPLANVPLVYFSTQVDDPVDGSTTYGGQNLISFTPGPSVDVAVGVEFLLGTFAFQNGEWYAASPIHQFTIAMVTNSSDPALDAKLFSDTLILNITPNGGPPENKADFFYFAGRPDLGSIRVYEDQDGKSNFGTADLYGKIGSLVPTRFANPTGGVFLDPSTDPFPFPPTAVPEPSTLGLVISMALALPGVWGIFKRRKLTTIRSGASHLDT